MRDGFGAARAHRAHQCVVKSAADVYTAGSKNPPKVRAVPGVAQQSTRVGDGRVLHRGYAHHRESPTTPHPASQRGLVFVSLPVAGNSQRGDYAVLVRTVRRGAGATRGGVCTWDGENGGAAVRGAHAAAPGGFSADCSRGGGHCRQGAVLFGVCTSSGTCKHVLDDS